MTMGKGAIHTMSQKQKLNAKSSTEAELVGADDVLPQLLWTKQFLQEQGYETKPVLCQDNMSAILLETNGTESSSRRMRHINIRHYFIKDYVNKKQLSLQCCSTDDMLANYPSKPLQGTKFKKFRKQLMNLKEWQG